MESECGVHKGHCRAVVFRLVTFKQYDGVELYQTVGQLLAYLFLLLHLKQPHAPQSALLQLQTDVRGYAHHMYSTF